MVNQHRSSYLVYVLRIWRNGEDTPWYVMLECARTGERLPFARLDDLFTFLEAETKDTQGALPAVHFQDTGQEEQSQVKHR
jgi:hypothetical protein